MMQIEIFRDAGWETSQMGHKKNSKFFVFDKKRTKCLHSRKLTGPILQVLCFYDSLTIDHKHTLEYNCWWGVDIWENKKSKERKKVFMWFLHNKSDIWYSVEDFFDISFGRFGLCQNYKELCALYKLLQFTKEVINIYKVGLI